MLHWGGLRGDEVVWIIKGFFRRWYTTMREGPMRVGVREGEICQNVDLMGANLRQAHTIINLMVVIPCAQWATYVGGSP